MLVCNNSRIQLSHASADFGPQSEKKLRRVSDPSLERAAGKRLPGGDRRCLSNATSKPTTSPPPPPPCRMPHDRACLAGVRGQGCADVRLLWGVELGKYDKGGKGEWEEEEEVCDRGSIGSSAGGRVGGFGIHAGAEGHSTAQVFHSSHSFRTLVTLHSHAKLVSPVAQVTPC